MTTNKALEPLTYSIPQVARLLGISRSGAYRLAREGSIPCLRIGPGRVVVPRQALDRLLTGAGKDTET